MSENSVVEYEESSFGVKINNWYGNKGRGLYIELNSRNYIILSSVRFDECS